MDHFKYWNFEKMMLSDGMVTKFTSTKNKIAYTLSYLICNTCWYCNLNKRFLTKKFVVFSFCTILWYLFVFPKISILCCYRDNFWFIWGPTLKLSNITHNPLIKHHFLLSTWKSWEEDSIWKLNLTISKVRKPL